MRNIPTELVLLQIAEGLQTLAKNPDLSATIKEAYALSEAEQQKADEARAIIVSADSIRAELRVREDAIANIDERIAEEKKLEDFNADTLQEIRKQQGELSAQAKKNESDAKTNKELADALEERSDALDIRTIALKDSEKEISNIKSDLKKRLDKMKDLAA